MLGEIGQRLTPSLRMGNLLTAPGWQNTLIPGAIYSSTASATANSNAVVTLIGTGVGSLTLPPNFLQIGTTIVLEGFGTVSTGASPSTIIITASLGGTAVAATNNGGVLTPVANMSTAQPFCYQIAITCRTTGVAGTVMANGYFDIGTATSISAAAASGTSLAIMSGTTPTAVTINTGIAQAITFTCTQATNTANTFINSNFNVYQLY